MPKGEARYPKPDVAKEMFLASPYYTWREFAESQGWNWEATRKKYPVPKWIDEKITVQNETFGAEVEGIMAEQSEHWYREVQKTIHEYPAMIDSAAQIVKYRSNQYLKMIQDDLKNKTDKFKMVPTVALRQLSSAIKSLTEAKYQSLMLSEMKVKEFEAKDNGKGRIVFEIAGGGSPKNIKKIMEDWNNK